MTTQKPEDTDLDVFETPSQALHHLMEHVAAGHDVPDYAIERLREEIEAENKP